MVCYLLWISAASIASEKYLHLFCMPIVIDCCGLEDPAANVNLLFNLVTCIT